MTDELGRHGAISLQAAALVTDAPQPASRRNPRAPYATLVVVLTMASTLVAIFDLFLFGKGLQ